MKVIRCSYVFTFYLGLGHLFACRFGGMEIVDFDKSFQGCLRLCGLCKMLRAR